MICDALNKRLLSVAELVRQDAIFADIGTDHAYLPLFLLKEGKIKKAYCSDINEGPLRSARINARDTGYEDEIVFTLADGADALAGYGITDYAICGMGGELISRIIKDAPHLFAEGVRLILQPMTKQECVRTFLAESGFAIVGERFSFDSGKYYATIAAEYTGVSYPLSEIDAELGFDIPHDRDRVEYLGYLEGKRKAIIKAIEGKKKGGLDTASDDGILRHLDERISRYQDK